MTGERHNHNMDALANILVVEDEPLIAGDIAAILTDEGYNVVGTANTADEAMYLARANDIDLVLLDIVIKGSRDGISTALALKRDFNPAIVFLSSRTDEMTVARAASIPPNGYILKPFRAPNLLIAVKTALANHKAGSEKASDQNALAEASRFHKGGLSPSNLMKVEDFLDKNFNTEFNVATLADLCGLSEQHFAVQFKKSTSMSPAKYVMNRRIEEAKCMLTETAIPISEIAKAVGYQNWAYFSTAFKRAVGVTPSAYRSA